ncbi:MAG: PIN domain nuclease [Nanoarchaeota archaeon]|nr:PIN domain nuclease [Nanoarchaeota archaeon]|tara:strand:+ start:502 stop:888 length:387 start_codon:yes stop_codon:yes gene_type:complete
MICIDTDCIIDFLKDKEGAVNFVDSYKDEIVTTEINVFEVFIGIYTKDDHLREEESAIKFFDSIEILRIHGWGMKAAEILANLIKNGNVIEENDCFIASIILLNGCNKIITRNEKHFSRIEGIEIIKY